MVAVIQVRMGSSRMPGKAMVDIIGKPCLWHVVDRVRHSKTLDSVVAATSTLAIDDPIKDFCEEMNAPVFRGSETDVLDRFYRAAKSQGADIVVRITADRPLIDPEIIDKVVEVNHSLRGQAAYITTANGGAGYPSGVMVELTSFENLEIAWKEATFQRDREHIMPFFYMTHPDRFPCYFLPGRPGLWDRHWTLDRPRDLKFIRAVFEALGLTEPPFGMEDILKLLDSRPDIAALEPKVEYTPYIRFAPLPGEGAPDDRFTFYPD